MEVVLSPYRDEWPWEFEQLAARLIAVLGPDVIAIDHVGSTAGYPFRAMHDLLTDHRGRPTLETRPHGTGAQHLMIGGFGLLGAKTRCAHREIGDLQAGR